MPIWGDVVADTCEGCGRKLRSVMLRTNGRLLCADCNQERWIAMDPRELIHSTEL